MNNKIFTFYKKNAFSKRKKAFTVAELLLTLTAIGIIAAIVMPATMLNINNKVFETQKQSIYSKLAQGIQKLPKLGNYGTLTGDTSGCTTTCNPTEDTAAKTFVYDGIAKVMRLKNICDNEHLADCNFPATFYAVNGTTSINLNSNMTNLAAYNTKFRGTITGTDGASYVQLNTNSAAFETESGESVIVFYNPKCENDLEEDVKYFSQPKMCANFVYDLNGIKGPNTVGKDIGFITVFYPRNSVIASPIPHSSELSAAISQSDALSGCSNIGEDYALPDKYEIMSMFYNMKLIGINSGEYWSSAAATDTKGWGQSFSVGRTFPHASTESFKAWCIKKLFLD